MNYGSIYLVLIYSLIRNGPEETAEIHGCEYSVWDAPINAEFAPPHENANSKHETLR